MVLPLHFAVPPQVPVAMDAVGWHLLLAFAPLEVQLYR
jgi:hypothetical protein